MKLRVFSKEQLESCSRVDLELKLNMVKTSEELTQKEIDDIKDGQADISDMGGF